MKILLKNGTVVSGEGCKRADVLIENEKISKVGTFLEAEDAKVMDLSGKLLFPGFIDAHTHFELEVAKTVTADDFESGTKAALVGGTTLVIDFATQYKGETLEQALVNWHKKSDKKASCDYSFHMAVSDWNEETSRQIETMIERGVTTFKLYMTYADMKVDDGTMYQILKRLHELGVIAGVHCENSDVIDALIKEAKETGHLGPDTHPKVRPAELEAEAVNRLLAIAKLAHAPVIVVHLTSRQAYEKIEKARKEGQKVFAETCPQYLILDDSVYERNGFEAANYVCSPPLRKSQDQECLWKALKAEKIQTMATDHCSFTREQKELGKEDFTKIPNGMPGVETRGTLLYTFGVCQNRISLEQMCKFLSENPARIYGVYPQKGCIREGSDADIVVFDPNKRSTITAAAQMYHMDYSPFEGISLAGGIDKVFLRGTIAVEDGKIQEEKKGVFVPRGKYQKDFL